MIDSLGEGDPMTVENIQRDRPVTASRSAPLPRVQRIGGVVGVVAVLAATVLLVAGSLAGLVRPSVRDFDVWCAAIGLPLVGVGVTLCLAAFSNRPVSLLAVGLVLAGAGVALPAAGLLSDGAAGWATGPQYTVSGALYGLPLAGPGIGLVVLVLTNRKVSWMFAGGQLLAAVGFLLAVFGSAGYIFAIFPEERNLYLIGWCLGTGLPLLGGGLALCAYSFSAPSRQSRAQAPPVATSGSEQALDTRGIATMVSGFAMAGGGMLLPLVSAFFGLDPLPGWCMAIALLSVCVGAGLCATSVWIRTR
jgi:hypothetical protein